MDSEQICIFSKGWNFSQDGPGNRFILHFQGCNLFCPWCSNPEGIPVTGVLIVNKEYLIDSVCLKNAIKNRMLNRNICQTCSDYQCLRKYRNKGIRLSCKSFSIRELLSEIDKARAFFHTDGGITITGGEPTVQFNNLKKLLIEIKKLDIHTVMETNGTHARLPELFNFLDIIIIDLKHHDSSVQKRKIGLGNEITMLNIQKAAESDRNIWIRIPLIPDFNDGYDNIKRIIEIIEKINRKNVSVELLQYHEYGKIKWEQVGMPYKMNEKKINAGDFDRYKSMFKESNINIINT